MDLCDYSRADFANSCWIFKLCILADPCFVDFYSTVDSFHNYKTSPAVFPHALLPRVAYATFHITSDTAFVQAGDTMATGTLGAVPGGLAPLLTAQMKSIPWLQGYFSQ